jgi:hypothetical protein
VRVLVACLLLLFGGIATVEAKPAPSNTIGILSIETIGVSDVVASQFELEVEESLAGEEKRAIDRETLHERLVDSDYVEGCLYGPCLAALRSATGVPLVLVARIQGEGSSYSFVITLVDTKTGMFTSQIADACHVCTIEEAIGTATLATISLLTGTGGAEVSKFSSSAAATTDLKSFKKVNPLKTSFRRTGLIFLGVGALAAVSAGYFKNQDKNGAAIVSGGAATAFIASGTTMLLLSRRF